MALIRAISGSGGGVTINPTVAKVGRISGQTGSTSLTVDLSKDYIITGAILVSGYDFYGAGTLLKGNLSQTLDTLSLSTAYMTASLSGTTLTISKTGASSNLFYEVIQLD